MADLDGHQIAKIIKAESPRTPIIMMTGWGTIMKQNKETAPEVDALVGKPPNLRQLNALLLSTHRPGQKMTADTQRPAAVSNFVGKLFEQSNGCPV